MSESKIVEIRPALGFRSMAHKVVASTADAVIQGINGNPLLYPNPIPTMAVFKPLVDVYHVTIIDAEDGGKKQIAARASARKPVVRGLRQLVSYVEANCNDDMATFLASGFKAVATSRTPSQPLTQPIVLRIDQGVTGQLIVVIKTSRGAKSSELRSAVLTGATPGPWTSGILATVRTPVNNLTPGTTYAFQVRALGPLGYTDWSDSATRMCI